MKKSTFNIQPSVGVCVLLQLILLVTHSLPAQNIIGGSTGDPSAVLDLRSSNKGLLLPRMSSEDRSAIANPAEGLLIYNTSLGCVEINLGSSSSPDWACMLALSGRITSLDCDGVVYDGTLTMNVPASGVSASLAYNGGNGGTHIGQTIGSMGISGLTATLIGGSFTSGTGSLVYNITGTPLSSGVASFALSIGGQNCMLNMVVAAAANGDCGAYIAPGVWKQFMCHNLGAVTTADPFVPSWELIGNYYQWGRNPSCFGRDGVDGANPCISPVYGAAGPWGGTTASDNAGVITGWSITAAPDGAWIDDNKTANDPCPVGFRVPTASQLGALADNMLNPRTPVGTWNISNTNYSSGNRFGESLFMPAAGTRNSGDGSLYDRGSLGRYWSSTESSSYAQFLFFVSNHVSLYTADRPDGFSLRCIAE